MWLFMLYGRLFVRHASYSLGSARTPTAPSQPYVPDARRLHRRAEPAATGVSSIVEIPVTLVPGVGVPFYGTLMRRLGPRVFDHCARFTSARRPLLHYMFHLLDLARLEGTPLEPLLRRSPGVGLAFERKQAFATHVATRLAELGAAVPMREIAVEVRAARGMDTG
jgi:hypothetical protein